MSNLSSQIQSRLTAVMNSLPQPEEIENAEDLDNLNAFRKTMASIYWLFEPYREGGRGRSYPVNNINYDTRGGDQVTVAWLNTGQFNRDNDKEHVGNVPFMLQDRDGELVCLLSGQRAGRKVAKVPSRVDKLNALSQVGIFKTSYQVINLVQGSREELETFLNDVREVVDMITPFTGARVLLHNPETEDIVAQIGGRNWVYPAAIDMVDPHSLRLTNTIPGAEGRRVNVPGELLATYLGLEEVSSERTEDVQDDIVYDDEDSWLNQ